MRGTGRLPRRRLSVDERRDQLIDTALELFSKRPPEEVSIDDIAAAAGASRPLVYRYFPGKQALYEEALRRAGQELARRLEEDEPGEESASERLYKMVGRQLDFVENHGPGFAALLRSGSVAIPGTTTAIDEVRQAMQVQALRQLALTEPSAGLRWVSRAWIASTEIAALDWLADRRIPREELQLQLVQQFMAMLVLAAAWEPELAPELVRILAAERPEGPAGQLVRQLAGLLTTSPPADRTHGPP
ncbi:TetR family transcriptional regulator [Streptomyces cellostaticus]|uniref:TetR family transcriptional regulator n=1 Tax=Streptomyces cellostaticus TaxID=67285 RepID=A0A101NDM6_9ACTN|nr:TetR family transcriptional regulator [Streptomyces cellostaticus]